MQNSPNLMKFFSDVPCPLSASIKAWSLSYRIDVHDLGNMFRYIFYFPLFLAHDVVECSVLSFL